MEKGIEINWPATEGDIDGFGVGVNSGWEDGAVDGLKGDSKAEG